MHSSTKHSSAQRLISRFIGFFYPAGYKHRHVSAKAFSHQQFNKSFSRHCRSPSTNFLSRLCYAHDGGDTMPRHYTILFNAITECIRILVAAQQAAEEEIIK
jgi:hypothetical protein